MARAVQLEALEHGYTVLTLNNGGSKEIEQQGVQRFLDQHVDAVIFCAALDPDNVRAIADSGTPLVQIERESLKAGGFSLVDPTPGMAEAIGYLRGLGHARIAYVGGEPPPWRLASPKAKSVEIQRVECFRRSMKSAGLDAPDELVRLGPYYIKGADRQPGRTMMHEVLALRDRPTAVIVGSDLLAAAGALQAFHESGVLVPEDMSVIGYDDTMADILTPPLTCIAQPIAELGRNAVMLALQAIAEPGAPARRIVAPTRFVVRHSVARPRSAD